MTPPLPVGPTTARVYGRLEEWRRADDDSVATHGYPPGWPLLRFLWTIAGPLDDLEELIDRIDYVRPEDGGTPGDTSDLADPATGNAGWLAWQARTAGLDLRDRTDPAERRAYLATAETVRYSGSEEAVASAVRPLLTGTRFVLVVDHYGADWTIGVVTLAGETAATTSAAILAAAELERPAGHDLVHDLGLTWGDLEANYPTWTAIEAAGSWGALVP